MIVMIDKNVYADFDELQIEGELDIVIELIDSYLSTSPKRFDIIVKSFDKSDFISMAREAHTLKSSSRTLGALKLGDLCEKIEHFNTAEEDTKILAELISAFKDFYQKSCSELELIRVKRSKLKQ